ncbi:MAG: type VI secretion protein IcmF/TssM N-terminal domain-containing protein [Lacipirellulaceae bacterium]
MADRPNDANQPDDEPIGPPGVRAPNPGASAGRAACLTGVILLTMPLVLWLYVWLVDPDVIPPAHSWSFWRIALVALLVLVIPVVVYRAVTLWLMGAAPRFADVQFAWRAGVEALAAQGIELGATPLFVVIGTANDELRRNLMKASGIRFAVDGVPSVASPLYWYATPDAIYLYVSDAAWTNVAAARCRESARSRRGGGIVAPREAPEVRPRGPATATLMPGAFDSPEPSPRRASLPGDGPTAPLAGAGRKAAYLGTLSPDDVIAPAGGSPRREAAPRPATRMASGESAQQLRRLESLCSLLRNYRHPLCPVNGVLVLVPYEILHANRTDIEELERSVSADLDTAQRELRLRCPVTALVVSMEQERGFCELIRRIGRDHAAGRFGQRFDLRREPTPDDLRRFSVHVGGSFEDWVYSLFREEGALSHPGNPAMFSMLCKVRRSFQPRLSDLLSKGFACDPQTHAEPLFFSGCYFAATGSQPERQAFVSGVLTKLRDEQDFLEWTGAALDADARRGRAATVGWCIASTLAAIAAFFWFAPDRG